MKKTLFILMTAVIIFSGCKRTDELPGKLVVNVTDDPFRMNYVEYASVTVTRIEIRKAGHNDSNPFVTLSEDTVTFNLLKLRNGIKKELINLDIPEGSYDMIRLYVEEATMKLKDRAEVFTVKVPSGRQTGIKIFIRPVLHVSGGLTSELLLDFDLARSFLMRGNMSHPSGINGFIFKPVIRATNTSTSGRIAGFVTDTGHAKLVNAEVWIARDTVIATSFTDSIGHYAFIGVPAGTYAVFATKDDYDTVSNPAVKVIEANRTIQDFELTPE